MGFYTKLYYEDLPSRAKSVYMHLKDHANKDNTCFPAHKTIAKDLSLSRSTVKRAISDLEKAGFLRKSQRWRTNGAKSSLLYEIVK